VFGSSPGGSSKVHGACQERSELAKEARGNSPKSSWSPRACRESTGWFPRDRRK
ncbi:unnamed protein product, partial [Musa textilis]